MVELQTARLYLRQWRTDDFPAFAALNADPEVMAFMPKRLTQAESDRMALGIRDRIEQVGWGLWAIEVVGRIPFIGFVGLSAPKFEAHFTPCVEVGWRLMRDQWGKGYATEAATAALIFGYDALRLEEIVSFTAFGNVRSRSVMKRLGMTHDASDDFDHPSLSEGHALRRHVLFRQAAADCRR